MRLIITIFFSIFIFSGINAQNSISGSVKDQSGEGLIGVNIIEEGTTNGTVSDLDGNFEINTQGDNPSLVFTYTGFVPQTIHVTNQTYLVIVLSEGISLDAIQVVGSRAHNRTATDSPVAIDVINLEDLTTRNGQVEINQILQYAAPSFNASKQSGSDGADHIDPASLRGLGPDQTLVLINGKRRHQSSLVNIFGTRGRGNTGTDLNNIPVAAIKRIEVLRDGASAQYGSDAIAGVINIVLKDSKDALSGSVTYGAFSTDAEQGDLDDTTPNAGGKNRLYDEDKKYDGNTVKVDANYGVAIGDKGGFANFTMEYLSKDRTLRPGASWRLGYGDAAVDGFNFMVNSAVPIAENTEIYVFGGRNYRNTDAYAFSRDAKESRTVDAIYPNGFTPRITSTITDGSFSVGVRHQMENGWNLDVNNTFGKNNFHYFIRNTNNASMEEASPTDFDAGGHSLSQNTLGLDVSKLYEGVMAGVNLAFGIENRTEQFGIFAGEVGSYATFDEDGLEIISPDQVTPTDSLSGDTRPGGSQGFPGYSKANEVQRDRSNASFYVDTEFNITEEFLLSGAVRYEDYSDFGNSFNYKLASRYKITDGLSFRASLSSGFRAPSLAQIYYNLRFTNFVGGDAQEVLLASNNSPVARGFGIETLKEEKAQNTSLGLTFKKRGFTATFDVYNINIKDRIVLTDQFDASHLGINVVAAQFFVNGIDTKTQGIDIVLGYKKDIGANSLNVGLTGNINKLEIEKINNGNLDVNTFFGPREQYFLKAAAPNNKFGLNIGFDMAKFNLGLAVTRFSEVIILDWQAYESDDDYDSPEAKIKAAEDVYEAGFVVDLVANYKFSKQLNFTIGANNLLNVYPTIQDDWTDSGGYWDSVQMGTNGRYLFARLGFDF